VAQDPFIRQVLAFAKDHNLDLSAKVENVSPWYPDVQERVDPKHVKKIAKALARGWPEKMPLPIVGDGVPYWLIDGSHRLTAARVAKRDLIPMIVISTDAYYALFDEFGLPVYDYIHSILPAVDPLMEENEKRDLEGGIAKNRSAQPWDMDAFL
jgi:hypothetical protein